jgi:hypothetical protein
VRYGVDCWPLFTKALAYCARLVQSPANAEMLGDELGYGDAVKLLDATLKEEKNTDSTLPRLRKLKSMFMQKRRKPRREGRTTYPSLRKVRS